MYNSVEHFDYEKTEVLVLSNGDVSILRTCFFFSIHPNHQCLIKFKFHENLSKYINHDVTITILKINITTLIIINLIGATKSMGK